MTRETPTPMDILTPRLVIIVGHEKKKPGATFALGGSEYQYNSEIANIIEERSKTQKIDVKVVFRDGIGISGAYKKAASLKPDACIELHFNAFNKKAIGTATLCSVESMDQTFAKLVHTKICSVFERVGLSRGVQVLPRSARGGANIYGLPGSANCLVEPFFGDVLSEAQLASSKKQQYAQCLIDAFVQWCRIKGLLS